MRNRIKESGAQIMVYHNSKSLIQRALAALLAAGMVLSIISINLLTPSPAVAQDGATLTQTETRLIEMAARKRGLRPSDLELLASSSMKLPLTRGRVPVAKLLNRSTGEVYSVAMNASGQEEEPEKLRAAEAQARAARYGKLDPVLYDRARGMRGSAKVNVAIWLKLKQDLDAIDPRTGNEDDLKIEHIRAMIAARRQQLVRAADEATRPMRSYLSKKQFMIKEVSLLAPLVYATVPVKALQPLQQRADVLGIYSAESVYEPLVASETEAVGVDRVWDTYGLSGDGIKVAVVEKGRVDFENTCMGSSAGTRDSNAPANSAADEHATMVAGVIASQREDFLGVAFDAGIYSANMIDGMGWNRAGAYDDAEEKADVQNHSHGPKLENLDDSMDMDAIHADYIVRYAYDTVVAASGNRGDVPGKEQIDGIAAGYNVIAVGAFDDNGTIEIEDDIMADFSSYEEISSSHGDRQKPEVVAPGVGIETLTSTDSGCASVDAAEGTSFAAPMVAGLAALLLERRPGLMEWPEAVRALIIAGATNNIEGESRLSDKDGAGGINAMHSVTSTDNRWFHTKVVTEDSFDEDGVIELPLGKPLAGTRVKVALAWDSNPQNTAGVYFLNPLDADLDLTVVGPGVGVSSYSYDNSYEVVEFTVPYNAGAGDYKIRIRKHRFDGHKEYVAVAWSMTFSRPGDIERGPVR